MYVYLICALKTIPERSNAHTIVLSLEVNAFLIQVRALCPKLRAEDGGVSGQVRQN